MKLRRCSRQCSDRRDQVWDRRTDCKIGALRNLQKALRYFFDQRTVKEPSSETLLRLAELVLTLNCLSFAGNYYKQINGVAMGTKMGPSYANLFVGYVEHVCKTP